jgi:hypothetical protein
MILAPAQLHNSPGVFDWLARGFVSSVGWMIARGLGLPGALVGVAVIGFWYWRRHVSATRGAGVTHED